MGSYEDWRKKKQRMSMGQSVGKIEEFEFLKETACIHIDERELIAYAKAFQRISPEEKDFNKFLKTVVVPTLKDVGRARWYRDTVTDLGLALSDSKSVTSDEDTRDILDAES